MLNSSQSCEELTIPFILPLKNNKPNTSVLLTAASLLKHNHMNHSARDTYNDSKTTIKLTTVPATFPDHSDAY